MSVLYGYLIFEIFKNGFDVSHKSYMSIHIWIKTGVLCVDIVAAPSHEQKQKEKKL